MRARTHTLLLGAVLPSLALALPALAQEFELPGGPRDETIAPDAAAARDPARLVGLPVVDKTGREVGEIADVVLRERGDELVVVDFDARRPGGDKLIGLNVNQIALSPGGDAVRLTRLKREYLGDLHEFTYAPEMRTVVPRG